VFIRPTIIRSAADARLMTERRYGYTRAQQYLQDPTREPSLDELLREYMGATPPGQPPEVPAPVNPALYLPNVKPGDQVVSPKS
jgi:general secretion pathway protein D